MQIKQASFIISVADYKKCPETNNPQIAIAGKSNVGKSSFINMMCNVSKLAKTSSEPGRTRLLNYFDINKGQFTFVDLPGYGFARVSDDEKEKWAELIEGYFANANNLCNVFVLVDIRHEPGAHDRQMIAYLHHYNIPFTVIATKADKLSRSAVTKQKSVIAKAFAMGADNIFASSATSRLGKEEILQRIEDIITAQSVDDTTESL